MDQSVMNTIRKFNKCGKDFMDSPNENTLASLNECMDTVFYSQFQHISPDKLEMSAFLSTLWDVMSHPKGPVLKGIALMLQAVADSSMAFSLAHNYRFMPILTNVLLNQVLTVENEILLLQLMKQLTNGIKISWHEPYIPMLVASLCKRIINEKETAQKEIFLYSLSILVNLCYGNAIVVKMLMESVNFRDLVKCLVSRKNEDGGAVQICRFLMIIQNSKGSPSIGDTHNYLEVALKTLALAIRDINENDFYDIDVLVTNLCSDSFTRPHVLCFDHYEMLLSEALKQKTSFFIISTSNKKSLESVFSILQNLVQLGIFTLRSCHKIMAEFCINASSFVEFLGPALRLLATIISQYEDDGMLPDDLMPSVSMGFHTLLDPINLNYATAGLDWIRFIHALSICDATREAVWINVLPERFENTFKNIINYHAENVNIKCRYDQEILLIGCHICLRLINRSEQWEASLHNILTLPSVVKVLNGLVSNVHKSQQRYFFQMIRHPDFPIDKINGPLILGDDSLENNRLNDQLNGTFSTNHQQVSSHKTNVTVSSQEQVIDELINRINTLLQNNEVGNNSLIDIMELYRYKISNLENRYNACCTSLESANKLTNILNNSISVLNSTIKNQEDLLYQSQIHNKKISSNYDIYTEQVSDAEKTIKKFQGKLVAEKLDKQHRIESIHREYAEKLKDLENKLETTLRECESFKSQLEETNSAKEIITKKLNDQTQKNGELAGVLIKFEDKVKQKEKKLEEVYQIQLTSQKELEAAQQTIKSLEKTVMERDKRLTQVTSQLEEMHRVQDIIANLMHKPSSVNNSSN